MSECHESNAHTFIETLTPSAVGAGRNLEIIPSNLHLEQVRAGGHQMLFHTVRDFRTKDTFEAIQCSPECEQSLMLHVRSESAPQS